MTVGLTERRIWAPLFLIAAALAGCATPPIDSDTGSMPVVVAAPAPASQPPISGPSLPAAPKRKPAKASAAAAPALVDLTAATAPIEAEMPQPTAWNAEPTLVHTAPLDRGSFDDDDGDLDIPDFLK